MNGDKVRSGNDQATVGRGRVVDPDSRASEAIVTASTSLFDWRRASHPGRTNPAAVRARLLEREDTFVDGEMLSGGHFPIGIRYAGRVFGFREQVVIDHSTVGIYDERMEPVRSGLDLDCDYITETFFLAYYEP